MLKNFEISNKINFTSLIMIVFGIIPVFKVIRILVVFWVKTGINLACINILKTWECAVCLEVLERLGWVWVALVCLWCKIMILPVCFYGCKSGCLANVCASLNLVLCSDLHAACLGSLWMLLYLATIIRFLRLLPAAGFYLLILHLCPSDCLLIVNY